MTRNQNQPGLRLMIYDATERRWGRFINLSLIWRIGGWLYRLLGRLDHCHGAASWQEALVWLGRVEPSAPIAEVQFWGHGKWGCALISGESLDIRCLDPGHALHEHLRAIRARLVANDSNSLVRDSHLALHAAGIPSHVESTERTDYMGMDSPEGRRAEKPAHTGKDSPEGGCEKGFSHQRSHIPHPTSPIPLWWFRTCETLGASCGQAFARAWADFLGCRVAGHTHVIGFYQSGLHSLRPGEKPTWSADEGIIEGDAARPLRAAESRRGIPNTITCLGGRPPPGW